MDSRPQVRWLRRRFGFRFEDTGLQALSALRRIIGDLSDREKVQFGLDLKTKTQVRYASRENSSRTGFARRTEASAGRLAESEATMKAIRNGEVDAIVVDGPQDSRIFTLQSPEEPYRIVAERVNAGAATLSTDGTILFCNQPQAVVKGIFQSSLTERFHVNGDFEYMCPAA